MKKFLLIVLALLIIVPAVIYNFFPGTLYSISMDRERSRAGLELKKIQVDDHTFPYLEGGSGETLVLLHGFGSEKDHWVRFARFIKGYHLLIPDLPGFGENNRLGDKSYDVSAQADRIKRFMDLLGIKKIHIAGNSMGGNISAIFAARYPEMVSSVVLVDTGGVIEPVTSELRQQIKKGINPLVAGNEYEYDRFMKFIFVKPPVIPGPVKKLLADKAAANRSFNEKVFTDITTRPAILTPGVLEKITVPVLIIWGDSDRVLNISSVGVLEKGIRNHTTKIMKDCGHSPMIERPEETAALFHDFYRGLKK